MTLADPGKRSWDLKTRRTKQTDQHTRAGMLGGSMHRRGPDQRHFLGAGNIKVSFEFFPPKTAEMEQRLWTSISHLEPLEPTHVAITYGAGGSTRDRTHATLDRLLKETRLKPAAHLTCVGATRSELNAVLQNYWSMGVRHI